MAPETAKVLSVNVGGVRTFDYHGRPAQSAIWKSPVSGRVAARGVNLAGDRQADPHAGGKPIRPQAPTSFRRMIDAHRPMRQEPLSIVFRANAHQKGLCGQPPDLRCVGHARSTASDPG